MKRFYHACMACLSETKDSPFLTFTDFASFSAPNRYLLNCDARYFESLVILTILVNCVFLALERPPEEAE